LWEWYCDIIRKAGADPSLGRKLYGMIVSQKLDPRVDVYSLPISKVNSRIWDSIINVLNKIDTMKNLEMPLIQEPNESIRRNKLISRNMVDGLISFSREKSSLFVFPLIFRVWAKKI
jgi:hypothetical protein